MSLEESALDSIHAYAMRQSWFRRTTWSSADREEFETRLARIPGPERAQYLRIQAVHLQQSGGVENARAALNLLDRLLTDYPDSIHVAAAHHARGKCLEDLGFTDEAIAAYQAALGAERDLPSLQTNAWMDLALLIVRHRLEMHYDALEDVLLTKPPNLVFPVERYVLLAARALIARDRHQQRLARELAREALGWANTRHSGFKRHPQLGLVHDLVGPVHQDLLALAEGRSV